MPTVADILSLKGDVVHAISPDATVLEAVHKMNHCRIGALVVMEEGFVVGMFTERDVLRLVGEEKNPSETKVGAAMARQVVYARLGTQLEEAGEMMKDRRIRHLPVCDELGRLRGVVSIGDLNAFHVQHQERTILALNEYIYGRA
jgi:CBS domain-containing protein